MLPAISPAVISHLAMPNSGVRRYAAALQSMVSAGARDRLARAEEPVVRRLCAEGTGSEPSLARGKGPTLRVSVLFLIRLFGWREPTRGDLKDWSCHAGPMV